MARQWLLEIVATLVKERSSTFLTNGNRIRNLNKTSHLRWLLTAWHYLNVSIKSAISHSCDF